jgi:hypothetical protein
LSEETEPQIDIEQVSVWDLLEAFDSICKATGGVADISRIQDDTPIDLYQIEILHRLQTEGRMTFERIFESSESRLVKIGLFLALLELIRAKLVWAKQPAAASSIYLRALTDEPAEQAVQNAILATAEADSGKHASTPAIPVKELPRETRAVVIQPDPRQQPNVPIIEVSSKNQPAAEQKQNPQDQSATDKQQETSTGA